MADTYKVQKGDTLSEIALAKYKTYGYSTWQSYMSYLVTLNDIENPNLIYVGQELKLEGTKTTAPSSTSYQLVINHFGLQSNAGERTVFATWKWDIPGTDHYYVVWSYQTGDGVSFRGGAEDVEAWQKYYVITAPDNAIFVDISVVPYPPKADNSYSDSPLIPVGGGSSSWSGKGQAKRYWFKDNPPTTPDAPSVEINDYTLTASLKGLEELNATHIQFRVILDNQYNYGSIGTAQILTGTATYSCLVKAGGEYKVQCRAVRDEIYSEWSKYSDNCSTKPPASNGITVIRATSETSVHLEWEPVINADNYEIEWTIDKTYFDTSNQPQSMTVDAKVTNKAEVIGLATGDEYFFRVRATNAKGSSAWTEIKSITIGKIPAAPTTWSSTTIAVAGEKVNLYWVHNAQDGSSQTYAILEISINGETLQLAPIQNSTDEETRDQTSYYQLDTSLFTEGSTVRWRVKTAGVLTDENGDPKYGAWSVTRSIDVYAPPTITMTVPDTVVSLPVDISIEASAGDNQSPIGYYVLVVPNTSYETVDRIGNKVLINKGTHLYSNHFDWVEEQLTVPLNAGNIDLQDGITYTASCVVSMNSGLTAEATSEFTVSWAEKSYSPNAEIIIDRETISAIIRPYCMHNMATYFKVTYDSLTKKYTMTNESIEAINGSKVIEFDIAQDGTILWNPSYTTTGEQVYHGEMPDGSEAYYCMKDALMPVEGVSLSVYRREFDGSFTEIIKNVDNLNNTHVVDPHPSLDYARYRIVATEENTGAISYYDMPAVPILETSAIVQWDETWSAFDVTSDGILNEPPYNGSMLKLPYNIDVSDNNDPDVTLIEYIGRTHPVGYYGTQLGEKQTWNVVIPKNDKETLYTIRRLAKWMGDVYVREPSGSGYWANIKVSYNQKHLELVIPVTLDITRVEGGV